MRQQNSKCLTILSVHQAATFNLTLEFEGGLPQVPIMKEQAGLELNLAESQCGIGKRPDRIDIEADRTGQRTWLLRAAKVVSGRNEGQFTVNMRKFERGQTFNKSFSVVALREFCRDEEMARRSEPIFKR